MTVLAAVQAASVWMDREASVRKACELIEEAGAQGADFIAFPENFIPGHPSWFHYVPASHEESIAKSVRLIDQSVVVPSMDTKRLAEAARAGRITAVIGLTERQQGASSTLYNTQLCIGPDGEMLGKHQKLVATMTERMVHSPGSPETQRTFDTPLGVVSALICGENSNPLALGMIAAQHPNIHAASWPAHVSPTSAGGVREISTIAARSVAHMLGAFVVSASGVNDPEMVADISYADDDKDFLNDPKNSGGACIVDPSGSLLAGPLEGNIEGIVYADVDLMACVRSRLVIDMGGHYNRPDIFRLTVNNRPAPLVDMQEDAVESPLLVDADESSDE